MRAVTFHANSLRLDSLIAGSGPRWETVRNFTDSTLLVLVTVESNDGSRDVDAAARRIGQFISEAPQETRPARVVIMPFVHASELPENRRGRVRRFLSALAEKLRKDGVEAYNHDSGEIHQFVVSGAMVDEIATTRLVTTPSSLAHLLESLLNAFSAETLHRMIGRLAKER